VIDFLAGLDSFVLPSRGEGFGLGGLEAMATGLPVIATNWSGPTEYLDPVDSFPLAYRLVNAAGTESHGYRYFGEWAEPDEEHLRTLMRWIYEHRAEARAMGLRASARVHADWTWDRVIRQLVADLEIIAAGASPFGR
jgi:glycosyltransferase involved in cell wall biosynthesis